MNASAPTKKVECQKEKANRLRGGGAGKVGICLIYFAPIAAFERTVLLMIAPLGLFYRSIRMLYLLW